MTGLDWTGLDCTGLDRTHRTGQDRTGQDRTIPVKLCFKDKETREAADARLKKLCKMGGIIPYHRTLRNVMNQTINDCKKKYPNSFIQVRVDVDKFQLKVSRFHCGEWSNNIETVDLPESVLDLSRMGPKMPRNPEASQLGSTDDMEVATEGESQQG